MDKKDYVIRLEDEKDYKTVENLIREAFWNVYKPGASEHFVVHTLRGDSAFVKPLAFVLERGGEIIGYDMFMRANLVLDNGKTLPILTMGPIGILPKYKRQGYGKILLDHCLNEAEKLGFGAVMFEGDIAFYGKSGFDFARNFSVRYHGLPEGMDDSFFLCKELKKGYLSGVSGVYKTPDGYFVEDADVDKFDEGFPYKEKLKLPGQLF